MASEIFETDPEQISDHGIVLTSPGQLTRSILIPTLSQMTEAALKVMEVM